MTLGILASFTDAWHIAPAGAASKVLAGEPAVRDLIESFAVAWNRGDVEALAVLFSPDGEFVSPYGSVTSGRAEIKKLLTGEFVDKFQRTTLRRAPTRSTL